MVFETHPLPVPFLLRPSHVPAGEQVAGRGSGPESLRVPHGRGVDETVVFSQAGGVRAVAQTMRQITYILIAIACLAFTLFNLSESLGRGESSEVQYACVGVAAVALWAQIQILWKKRHA